ncbi:MAG: glycerol-3-phosphate dehydrogenase [Alphaproteobacteria bacterium]|nr:glycerol-3-phosphate dehydrogenase [Alphaproteobacteria bacterium]
MVDPSADFDLAIIGGGINGAGIARDAAGRGLSVLLVEQSDLASGASSKSTKLIHGGLRYLEFYAFRLVREALIEREVLIGIAPHLTRPLRFVLPHHSGLRPVWMLRLGLFLYDHLGGRKILPGTEAVDLTHHVVGQPLKREYRQGFIYSDGWVDDARLVVLNVVDAAERGAVIRTRTRLARADRAGERWELVLNARGRRETVTARVLVNAAGPWVPDAAAHLLRQHSSPHVRLIKGSHVIVPRLFEHDHAYIFQNADSRIVFAIPYERDFTLIGTTDQDFKGDLAAPTASADEINYLCGAVSVYFRKGVMPDQVVSAYSGVRQLYDDGARSAQNLTREYVLDLEGGRGEAPLLTVYGGKITTYRRLAEAALAKLATTYRNLPGGLRGPWTASAALPGGDFPHDGVPALAARARGLWPFLTEANATRMVRAYGTRLDRVLGEARDFAALGERFGDELTAAEVRYLRAHEFAETADDVLWRRSKLGLRVGAEDAARLSKFMEASGDRAAAE